MYPTWNVQYWVIIFRRNFCWCKDFGNTTQWFEKLQLNLSLVEIVEITFVEISYKIHEWALQCRSYKRYVELVIFNSVKLAYLAYKLKFINSSELASEFYFNKMILFSQIF